MSVERRRKKERKSVITMVSTCTPEPKFNLIKTVIIIRQYCIYFFYRKIKSILSNVCCNLAQKFDPLLNSFLLCWSWHYAPIFCPMWTVYEIISLSISQNICIPQCNFTIFRKIKLNRLFFNFYKLRCKFLCNLLKLFSPWNLTILKKCFNQLKCIGSFM